MELLTEVLPFVSQYHLVIQFLQHGIGFDRSYWDFALNTIDGTSPNNASYVQVANAAGYATLAIDRLGELFIHVELACQHAH